MKNFQEVAVLLTDHKNLILTGAPGTGKTYATAEIALRILGKTDIKFSDREAVMKAYQQAVRDGVVAFTTFHQSMDYEEFLEGLKPYCDDDGKVAYHVESGIFKRICQEAEENYEASQKSEEVLQRDAKLNTIINKFLDDAIENKTTFKTPTHKIEYEIADIKDNKIKLTVGNFSTRNEPQNYPYRLLEKKELLKLLERSNKYTDKKSVVEAIPRPINHFKDNYLYALYSEIYDNKYSEIYGNNSDSVPKVEKVVKKNYVLIIDEINRGNISKIFGELITLLEKDKRLGEENEISVKLPYSQETFGVPSNLYIIGTMNTADRSIGHIDYAVRRRFAFVPLKADRSVIEDYGYGDDDTKQKALEWFDTIKKLIETNINADLDAEDLMIGHSYFLCKTVEELKRRLEYEIIPLIEEYGKDGIIAIEKGDLKNKFDEWKKIL
jgi:5-methylcytosine-specific restriction protein B